ncbi:tRNA (adenosine(37)-N6)-threonylcarbamoyltransferase complex dimerization subunit type 1 TsaB [Paraconexibacter antarcticus]|uniref:N(6)-L-threonylcarbamoyladenine synthase n=1 Tax=Paraconexibacter antarcticus TaxID=2949664 RepID=A0ABY5DLW9_9ACTN|nr:tRNA (adenosine(37)-N6)-threonylcarbamoyltransferase complex dimerization subunit type 1 TsaB [Paraconexibacter antarcticus]UTI62494.1 tRNA (adenosine(37)-N6)-threonylcarbamoyltransferase complex dimerization subunit type 1 TsaB [Paraconexibacter antarcticus]
MIVLGLDTATGDTAVGLLSDTDGLELALRRRHEPDPGARPGHAEQLLALAGDVLHEASLTWGAVDRIAVGLGPGTFTGLRIGVATGRALAQASGAGLAGVSTLQALAEGAGHDGPVLACVDARRGELFVGAWDGTRVLLAPQAVAPDALAALVAATDGLAETALAVGDGAVRHRADVERAASVPADDDPRHHVDGLAVCRLARYAPETPREALVPDYVRRPDAVRTADREAAARA